MNSPSQEDEGQYTCVATSSAGTAFSSVRLDVKEPPPQVTAPEAVTAHPSHPSVLTCHVTSGVAHNMTWSRYVVKGQVQDFYGKTETIGDFVDVEKLEGYQVLANSSLLLQWPGSQDEGWFRCTAANEGGRQSREVYVTVHSLPGVSVIPEVLPFRRGDNLTLSCVGQGSPLPSLAWWRGNVSLTEATEAVTPQKINLHMSSVTREDEGTYVCTATTMAGTGKL
ncbi:Hemicentin-1 [Chionoecetes opilio]|uniref:Hemicentin-1 n=1 Tax=Chionoecetes opilio TaxID=41210 RepID=A0A8J5D4J5_CHIOP|nr:Hemicentin-1 [Chionoecetes opilio]